MLSGPAGLVCQAAANEPFDAAWTVATGAQLEPGAEPSWSISTVAPASAAGTLPVTDSPLRTKEEAFATRVTPPLLALTGTLPASTLTFGLPPDDGPDEAPPEPAQASPGITSAPAMVASNGAT
jgi:hypothetical protein